MSAASFDRVVGLGADVDALALPVLEFLSEDPRGDLPEDSVPVCLPTTSLKELLSILSEKHHVFVTAGAQGEPGPPLSVITPTDVLRLLDSGMAEGAAQPDTPMSSIAQA